MPTVAEPARRPPPPARVQVVRPGAAEGAPGGGTPIGGPGQGWRWFEAFVARARPPPWSSRSSGINCQVHAEHRRGGERGQRRLRAGTGARRCGPFNAGAVSRGRRCSFAAPARRDNWSARRRPTPPRKPCPGPTGGRFRTRQGSPSALSGSGARWAAGTGPG